jgi:hypothetical protein
MHNYPFPYLPIFRFTLPPVLSAFAGSSLWLLMGRWLTACDNKNETRHDESMSKYKRAVSFTIFLTRLSSPVYLCYLRVVLTK